jgi:glucosamine--fructose-6-phosphate aminotransferase (isomerizing)
VLTLAEVPKNNAKLSKFFMATAVGSLIARTTKYGMYLNTGRENAVASTKAFVTQVMIMGMIASWFAQNC